MGRGSRPSGRIVLRAWMASVRVCGSPRRRRRQRPRIQPRVANRVQLGRQLAKPAGQRALRAHLAPPSARTHRTAAAQPRPIGHRRLPAVALRAAPPHPAMRARRQPPRINAGLPHRIKLTDQVRPLGRQRARCRQPARHLNCQLLGAAPPAGPYPPPGGRFGGVPRTRLPSRAIEAPERAACPALPAGAHAARPPTLAVPAVRPAGQRCPVAAMGGQ